MTLITHCENPKCGAEIYADSVVKATVVSGAPMHTVLVYDCQACNRRSQIVSETQAWKALQAEYAEAYHKKVTNHELNIEIEMRGVEGPDDLVNIWKAEQSPPIIEEHISNMAACCDDCRRRLYVQRKNDRA